MTKQWRKLDELKLGPIRHRELPLSLVARIESLRLAIDEVYPQSMSEWLDGFQRDVSPEDEVLWWERLAYVYLEYSRRKALTGAQKHAAFTIIFKLALGSVEQVETDLAHLPVGALDEIVGILRRPS